MVRLDLDPGPLRAYEMVMGFAARRGEAATRLAMHAAVPLVLRVELLHLIRLNFLPEAAHDLAIEADVLFASYCEDMGNGYFCFASNARLQLLQGLDPAYPDESVPRSAQVARFMLDYLDHKQRNVGTARDRLRSQWIEVERWNALAFAEPELAAGQFAAVLARATAKDDVAARLRVGGLSTALATPLARFGELLVYAEGIDALQMGRTDDADRLFGSMPDREIEIAGIRLKSPRQVLTGYIGKEAPDVQLAESAEQEEARSEVPAEQAQTEEAPLEHPKPARDQIYISYSHRDQQWRDHLVIFLKPVVRPNLSVQSDDAAESSGKRWEEQDANAIGRVRLAIVLVSPNYLASDYAMERELPALCERARAGDLILTWLCVTPCLWSETPLREFQAAHDPDMALDLLSVEKRDSALAAIAQNIADALKSLEASESGRAQPKRGRIFMVYRHDDTAEYARRLYGSLRARIGDRVFIDVADINPGENFPKTIQSAISEAVVVLVLIGPNWLESRDQDGRRRIDSSHDYVRAEVLASLRRGIPVVPVLVGGAAAPAARMLPDDMRALANVTAFELRDSAWEHDCEQLAHHLEPLSPELESSVQIAQRDQTEQGDDAQVFISYALADDVKPPFENTAMGWVTFFWSQLRWELTNLGLHQAKLWLDRYEIEPLEDITEKIAVALNRARLFIVIISRNYLMREFCLRELQSFLKIQTDLGNDALSRLVLIYKNNVETRELPPALREREGFKFFRVEPSGAIREFYWRGMQDPEGYFRVLRDVASLIARRLTEKTDFTESLTDDGEQPHETPESSLAARKSLEASLALDPHSAEAWGQLALVLIRGYVRNWNHARLDDVDRAEEAVAKAFAINRSIALAHVADGYIRQVKGDHLGALDAFDQGIALSPNNALALAQKAQALVFLGRAKEAPPALEKAITISPRDPDLGIFYFIMGQAYFAMGDYDNAIDWLQKSVQLQPTLWFNRAWSISAYALTGRLEQPDAQAALIEYREKFKNWPLPKIRDWFSKTEPHPSPGCAATLQELFKGLRMAGV